MRISDWSSDVCSSDLPYRFKERVQNDHITLEKFPQYWDAASYHFDTVRFSPVPDSTVRLNNMRSGGLDIIERFAPSDVETVQSDPNLAFMPVTGLGFQAISIHFANGPRADIPFAKDDRQSTRLNYSHKCATRMPSSACKNKSLQIN